MPPRAASPLVIDIGGTHVKLMRAENEERKFPSGPDLTPPRFIDEIKKNTADWTFDVISIGFPAPVRAGEIIKEPKHIGHGWIGYNFTESLGKPVRVINDAAMQALGSYQGGRMLFLGLGTGLGSALLWENNLLSLELGDLPYPAGVRIEQQLGQPGLEKMGEEAWKKEVLAAAAQLRISFIADYVVLGGGNARLFDVVPENVKLGSNRNAFRGGCRLWEIEPTTSDSRWNFL